MAAADYRVENDSSQVLATLPAPGAVPDMHPAKPETTPWVRHWDIASQSEEPEAKKSAGPEWAVPGPHLAPGPSP